MVLFPIDPPDRSEEEGDDDLDFEVDAEEGELDESSALTNRHTNADALKRSMGEIMRPDPN